MEKKRKAAMYLVAPTVIFIITYFICYQQAIQPGGDIVKHMQYALSLDRVLSVSHCGWHFVCWLFYACLPVSIEVAASLATASFNVLTALIVVWIVDRCFDYRPETAVYPTIITLISLLVGPCYLRFYNENYYLGQGSPNVWHNPTTIAVRPFMLLIGVLTIDYWSCGKEDKVQVCGKTLKKTTAYELGMGLLLLLSTLVKPSFLMVYGPVCVVAALVRLIRAKGKNFLELIVQHLYFVPSLLLFLSQYIRIYIFGGVTKSNSGIEIAFFKVARLYASSVTVSLLLKMAFPFLVIIIWRKYIFKDKMFQLIFGQFLVGLAITWTFAETGSRAKSGNFGWGNILASSFLWIFCVIYYARELKKDRQQLAQPGLSLKLKYGIPAVFLLWHLLGGLTSLTTYMNEFT